MFDKLYKEANDEIPVNEELLKKLKCEASKVKRKNPYSFIYKYGFAAAALLIVVVSLNALPAMNSSNRQKDIYTNNDISIKQDNASAGRKTSENSAKEETPGDISQQEKKTNMGADKKSTALPKNNVAEKSTQKNETVKKNEEPSEKVQQETASDSLADVSGAPLENVPQQSYSAGAAEKQSGADSQNIMENHDEAAPAGIEKNGGGSNAQANSGNAKSVCEASVYALPNSAEPISLDEYCEYYGFNLKNISVPQGMEMIEGNSVFVETDPETGAYIDKTHSIVYSGESKEIIITLFAGADMMPQAEEESFEQYKEGCRIARDGDKLFKVYIVKDGLGIIIESDGIEKESIYSLVDSIS